MLSAGQIINDDYRLERLLGSGGMADVYQVSHVRLPKQFALKILRTEGTDPELTERFRREAEILATLRHLHLVDVSDWDVTADGRPYLVMELLEGEDLSHFLQRTGRLRLPVALHICLQIGEALSAAHKMGIIHRDLKPANVFLCRNQAFPNFVKVLDFGIAKLTQPSNSASTGHAVVMGTPGYMPPEQSVGAIERIDHRSDQFALAAILYEMLAGHPAFYQRGDTTSMILDRVLFSTPEPLDMPHIDQAIRRALSKDPNDRFADIGMFLAAVGATTNTIYTPPSSPSARSSISLHPGELIGQRPSRRWTWGWRQQACIFAGMLGIIKSKRVARSAPVVATPVLRAVTLPLDSPEPNPNLLQSALPNLSSVAEPPASVPGPILSERAAVKSSVPTAAALPLRPLAPARTKPGAEDAITGQPKAKGPVRLRPLAAAPRRFLVTIAPDPSPIKHAIQQHRVAVCVNRHLTDVPLPNRAIQLLRSGNLKGDVDTPPAVHSSGLYECLQNIFPVPADAPKSALIRVFNAK